MKIAGGAGNNVVQLLRRTGLRQMLYYSGRLSQLSLSVAARSGLGTQEMAVATLLEFSEMETLIQSMSDLLTTLTSTSKDWQTTGPMNHEMPAQATFLDDDDCGCPE